MTKSKELPLKTMQFPAFTHRTEASTVTSGLASYITPTTPSGTLTFFKINPLGRLYPKIISPTGSVNLITLSILSAFFPIVGEEKLICRPNSKPCSHSLRLWQLTKYSIGAVQASRRTCLQQHTPFVLRSLSLQLVDSTSPSSLFC